MHLRAAVVIALLSGCTPQHGAPPALPEAGVAARSEPEEPTVAPPSTRTPAFAPAKQGACTPDYRLMEGTCVHRAYVVHSDAALQQALALYRAGAVPPMLGPPPPATNQARVKGPLGPGSLMKASRGADGDAGVSAKDRRLAELDTMIAAAREQLRQRDEAGKAKRVDGPARSAGAPANSQEPQVTNAASFVGGTANPVQGAPPAGGDPLTTRLTELSQLTGTMSVDQLRALTTQLGGMGMDPAKLDSVLQQAGATAPRETSR